MDKVDVSENEFKMSVSEVQGEIDYDKAMRDFGIDPMDTTKLKIPRDELPLMYRRGLVVGQRDFAKISDAINSRKRFAVLTGRNPSDNLHLGHVMFINQALFFQQYGGEVYIPISNDEAYVFKKVPTIEQATKNAYEKALPDMIALGLDPKKTHIFVSTRTKRLYELAVKLSTKTTFSTIKAIFGFTNETNPGQIFYAIMQSAHILFPQLAENGGPRPVVVPIGIDQDPYMRLVRDMAERVDMIKPSSTYHKFMPGLQGGKMSGSKPETCIYLTDSPETARKKIMKAFSGGAASLREHREKGGDPNVDVACQYLYFMFEPDDGKIKKIFDEFRSGAMTSGDVKSLLADRVCEFLTDFQKRREKALDAKDKFLLE